MTKYNMNMNASNINQKSVLPNTKQTQPTKKPNEQVGFHFSSSMKITDPNTGQVLLQMRCD